jgi:hypothetical protein
VAEIILYVDINFGGLHTHLFESTPDFTQLHLTGVDTGLNNDETWNDKVSSFVIVSGVWQFFKDINFQFQQGNPGGLGPGLYHFTQEFGIDNDSLSSVRLISE